MKNRKTDWSAVNTFFKKNTGYANDDIRQYQNIMKEMENGGAERILESTIVKWNRVVNKGRNNGI